MESAGCEGSSGGGGIEQAANFSTEEMFCLGSRHTHTDTEPSVAVAGVVVGSVHPESIFFSDRRKDKEGKKTIGKDIIESCIPKDQPTDGSCFTLTEAEATRIERKKSMTC